jgi:hypothetical protein
MVHNKAVHNMSCLVNIRMKKMNDIKVGGECGMHRRGESQREGKG